MGSRLTSPIEPLRPHEEGLGQVLRITAGVMLGLLFLIGPLSDFIHSSPGPARTAAIATGFAAFLVLYATAMRAGRLGRLGPRATLAVVAALAVLPAAMLAFGAPSSFALLYVFFAAAVGMRLRPQAAAVVILLTAIGLGVAASVDGESSSSIGAKSLTVLAIGAMMIAFSRQIRVNRQLQAARNELARLAVTEERLRIARDLHDLLGHSLSVIALKSELAEKLLAHDPERAAAELGDVQAVGRQALAEVREAVQGYRRLALSDALIGARSALSAAGIAYEVERAGSELPPDVEELFAWAVREGTTNVLRHSAAETCAVRIRDEHGQATVEVEDDGRAAPAAPSAGSGLSGLAERAARLRGRLEAGPAPGGGFRLRLVVPLQP
ncbi:MAG TPA: histidine kinase [Gaiellaceae bacterium]|nr:histidine kinase [Gaiellaceae bacterium]